MSYILNQFNQATIEPTTPIDDPENMKYMTSKIENIYIDGSPKRKPTAIGSSMKDECIETNIIFDVNTNYYFHGIINKRNDSDQIFYVYLAKYDEDNPDKLDKKQYLKTIIVNSGDPSEWIDVEFVFTPFREDFNYILFQLQRDAIDLGIIDEDTGDIGRHPLIVYEELAIIKNAPFCNYEIIKMGVQAHEGLYTVINSEGIHIGKSELYEIKNDIVTVNFFGVVSAATDPKTEKPTTESRCDFTVPGKTRGIRGFVVDYIYNDDEEEV